MNVFMEFFLFFMSILQFLFPFAFKDTEVPVQPTDPVVEETVIPGEHVHTGGNGNCLQSAVCEICGEIYGGKGEHVYAATVTPATCTDGGYTTYVCRFCLQSKVEDYTAATGHTYEKTSTKATCVFAGYDYYSCINCVDSYSVETESAKGHSYEDEYFSANCTEGYRVVHKCKTCKSSYSEEVSSSLGHDYTETITAPTCQKGGYTTFKCIRCPYSYTGAETGTVNHTYTNYVKDAPATCISTGTKIAYCDYGCGTVDTIAGDEALLPHADNDKDTICDTEGCTEKIYVDYTYLQYPDAALANVAVNTFISKADDAYADGEMYAANAGFDHNGIIKSPYFTAKIHGRVNGAERSSVTPIPVYGTVVYVGETGKGALHSFSEIYITEGEYDTFTIEIDSAGLAITDAVILPESSGEKATVSNGKVTAVLSGLGTHTFLFNNENQQYAYTVHVRAQIDDNAAIEYLESQGYNVIVIEGYHKISELKNLLYSGIDIKENVYSVIQYGDVKKVIYLKKGTYLVADHVYDINSSEQESSNADSLTVNGNTLTGFDMSGIGQNRAGAINIKGSSNVQILGYGAIDLSHLDRGERRGAIISWSDNVRIQGLKFINAPQWSLVTYRVNGMEIKDVDIYGYRLNSDAFDICNSNNVTVDGCFSRSGDDAFVVKTLGGDDNATSNNVNVENCYAWVGKARAFGIFGEAYKNISNVTFKNNTVLFHDAVWNYLRIPAIGIVVEPAYEKDSSGNDVEMNSGSTLSNILFENIEICRNRSSAMNCLIFDKVNNFTVDGLTFRNISFERMNQVVYEDKYVNSVSTINRFTQTENGTVIRNVVIENILCGDTKVTDQNYTNYFNPEVTVYCGSFK